MLIFGQIYCFLGYRQPFRIKVKILLKHLVGKYRELLKNKKTAADNETNSISEEKPKQSKMPMDSLSEQGNLLWGIDNCLSVAGFVVQVR